MSSDDNEVLLFEKKAKKATATVLAPRFAKSAAFSDIRVERDGPKNYCQVHAKENPFSLFIAKKARALRKKNVWWRYNQQEIIIIGFSAAYNNKCTTKIWAALAEIQKQPETCNRYPSCDEKSTCAAETQAVTRALRLVLYGKEVVKMNARGVREIKYSENTTSNVKERVAREKVFCAEIQTLNDKVDKH